ncbi:MAG TPA: type II secretion system protein [Candidatus Brocadiia bacterium]|nr:type II secretion system protein [Candidatus Brocadiia bacterium]
MRLERTFAGMRDQKSRGFTLMELLVVIAVISILAAMLLPVTAQSRSLARFARCRSNMRQLAMANQIYADDYAGQIITTRYNNLSGKIYPYMLKDYLGGQKDVFLCPEEEQAKYAEDWNDRGSLAIGLNREPESVEGGRIYENPPPHRRLGEYKRPYDALLFADSTCGPNYRGFQVRVGIKPDTQSGISSRHRGRTNMVMVDSTAKAVKTEGAYIADNAEGVWWYPYPKAPGWIVPGSDEWRDEPCF